MLGHRLIQYLNGMRFSFYINIEYIKYFKFDMFCFVKEGQSSKEGFFEFRIPVHCSQTKKKSKKEGKYFDTILMKRHLDSITCLNGPCKRQSRV